MNNGINTSVLVIEDVEDIRMRYIRGLKRAGFDVDGAHSKDTGIQSIRCRTYDIAMIDLNLLDNRIDVADRSGLEVIRYIKDLNEGTRCLVVSGQRDIDSGIGAFEAGMDAFLKKNDIRTDDDVVRSVSKLASEVQIKKYGPFDHLNAYLCKPEGRTEWESSRLSVLGLDANRFNLVLSLGFEPLLPILRTEDSANSLVINRTNKELRGMFWSKKIGSAVEVMFSATKCDDRGFADKPDLIVDKNKFGVSIQVRKIKNLNRNQFEDRILLK